MGGSYPLVIVLVNDKLEKLDYHKMAPPVYADLGKSARDIFGKGYHFGVWKLECKTKTTSGVEFTANTNSAHESGKVDGAIETKYKCKEYGVTFTEKWNTNNSINTEGSVEDQLAKGLKLSLDTSFQPQTGKKDGSLNVQYKQDAVSFTSGMKLDLAAPVLNSSLVFGYQGWLAGYQAAFDVSKSKFTKSNFALGYDGKDYILHSNVNDHNVFGASVYHKVNCRTEAGVQLGWTASSNAVNFAIGAKHALDKDTFVRAEVNNSAELGVSYQQKLRDGMTLTMSTQLDTKNFNQGGHKIGVALEFSA